MFAYSKQSYHDHGSTSANHGGVARFNTPGFMMASIPAGCLGKMLAVWHSCFIIMIKATYQISFPLLSSYLKEAIRSKASHR